MILNLKSPNHCLASYNKDRALVTLVAYWIVFYSRVSISGKRMSDQVFRISKKFEYSDEEIIEETTPVSSPRSPLTEKVDSICSEEFQKITITDLSKVDWGDPNRTFIFRKCNVDNDIVIAFLPVYKIIDTIRKLGGFGEVYGRFPRAYYYEQKHIVPIENASIFFEAILEVQKEDPNCISIPKCMFKSELDALEKYRYVKSGDAKKWLSEIITKEMFFEYKEAAEGSKDPQKALSLAYFYLGNDQLEDALEWVIKAQEYLYDQPLSSVMDVDAFFSNFTEICIPDSILTRDNEIITSLSRSSTLKKVSVPGNINYCRNEFEVAEVLSSLLRDTKSIEEVHLTSSNFGVERNDTMDVYTAKIFTPALQVNSSIKKLCIPRCDLCSDGVTEILTALYVNPNCQIRELDFGDCNLTDMGAQSVIDYLLMKGSAGISVYIGSNYDVSDELIDKLQRIVDDTYSIPELFKKSFE